MSNMPCVSYSLSNMIINVFKKSNEVFTISTFTSPACLNFPVSAIETGISEGWKRQGKRAACPPLPPRPRLLFARGGTTDNSGKLRLKFLKSAGSTPKKGKVQEWAKRN